MGIMSGNPKHEPLHYGEAFDIWGCAMSANLAHSFYQTLKNHAGDKDLKQLIEDFLDQMKKEAAACNEILTRNDIAPPPSYPDKPQARLEDIPVGARLPDPEIAANLSAAISAGLVLCSQVMGKSIREDVGALFTKFHAEMTALGLRALRLNKEKGWLVPPPLQIERREHVPV